MEYQFLSDELLVKLLRVEDEGAFKEIYKRYFRVLSATAKRKIGVDEDVEEIMQDIYLSLWEKRLTLSIENLKAYLFGALKYKIIDVYKNKYVLEMISDETIDKMFFEENTAENLVDLNQIYTILNQTITSLPDKTSAIFRLNRIENKTVREISETLSIPERTVEYHISKALTKLRFQLKDYLPVIILCNSKLIDIVF